MIKCLLQAFKDIKYGMEKGELYQTEEEIIAWMESDRTRRWARLAEVELPEDVRACVGRVKRGRLNWQREGYLGGGNRE